MFVEVETPVEGVLVRAPVPLVEVKGWAGTRLRGDHDVLLVVDRSLSAWRPTGVDIDGDGEVGQLRPDRHREPHPFWTTDAGDTIYNAEVIAAGKLIERLDPRTVRMGLVTFAGGGQVRAPLGSSAFQLASALRRLPAHGQEGGTNFRVAVKRAIEEFERAGDPGSRHRSLMFLSDGFPSTGKTQQGERVFLEVAAKRAVEAKIRIYGFAIGEDAVKAPDAFKLLTSRTGGELMLVEDPGDVVDVMPYTSLAGVERVEIDNLSTSTRARSVRVFPDGSFDAYSALHPGLNILRVTAHGADGGTRVVDRRIHFEQIAADTDERAAEARRLLRELRVRTIEMELAERARRKREKVRWRELEIQVDE